MIDDAAQSFGASWQGNRVGTLASITCTSFFPAKPLGCYGDGGAVFTNDDIEADIMRSCRIHGMGKTRYEYERIGMTARLDTMQAVILDAKLAQRYSKWPDFIATAPGVAYAYLADFRKTRPDLFRRTDTIEDLASMLGMETKTLRRSVDQHNGLREDGGLTDGPFFSLGPAKSYICLLYTSPSPRDHRG